MGPASSMQDNPGDRSAYGLLRLLLGLVLEGSLLAPI